MTKKRKKLDKDIAALKSKWEKLDESNRAERWAINAQINQAMVKSGVKDWPWLEGKFQRTGTVAPKK